MLSQIASRQTQKRGKMFSVLNRIKVVKNHIVTQLDTVISLLAILHSAKDITLSRLEKIDNTASSLTENDTSLLQTSIYLVEALQQTRADNKQQTDTLLQKIEALQQTQNNHKYKTDTLLQTLEGLQQQIQEKIEVLQQQKQADDKQQNDTLLQRIETLEQQNQTLEQQNQTILSYVSKDRVNIKTNHYSLLNPEVGLMAYLYSYLPNRNALDIGASTGEVSQRLLESGYRVYAFEPFPSVFDKLCDRLGEREDFHTYKWAIGFVDRTMDLHIASDLSEVGKYGDATLYNSLAPHSMLDDLAFTSTIQVPVRSLESLHESTEIPSDISLVKIDAEGYELEVIRGMGKYKYPVVVAEFWDAKHVFGKSGALNRLEDLVREMRQRDYHWHIVIYRVEQFPNVGFCYQTSFYCNQERSVENSWGNVFFFQDYNLFTEALKWCSAALPTTYFNG